MHVRFSLGLALSTMAPLAAQSITVPVAFDSIDAPSMMWLPGAVVPLRQQILIGAGHLTSARGKSITGIAFRRDTGARHAALSMAQPRWTVTLSTLPAPAHAPSGVMADNVGTDAVIVFQGTVSVPASPSVAPRAAVGWGVDHALQVPFATPFAYGGGTLCVDIEGDLGSVTSDLWAADAAFDPTTGTASLVGSACGTYGGVAATTASALADTLVAGGRARFLARGAPGGPALAIVALAALPNAISLGFLGAGNGCALHVAPGTIVGTLPAVFGAGLGPRGNLGGVAAVEVPLPADTGLMGARFAVQWLDLTAPIASTNALDCAVAGGIPTLDMATVDARIVAGAQPTEGLVRTVAAPVVRFDYR